MLAVIGKIISLVKVENADTLQQAEVVCGKGGKWLGVVKQGQLTTGDKVVVFLQDALLPPNPVYQFMEKSKWIVKIAKLRGAYSECLIMPFKAFFERDLEVGTDVTFELGVQKYEEELPANAAGKFSPYIPKTFEHNFQAVPSLVAALQGKPYYIAKKEDGTSCTVYNDGQIHVCCRTYEVIDDGNVYWRAVKKFNLAEKVPVGYAIQFEIVGPGVKKNPGKLPDLAIYLFDVFDMSCNKYYGLSELREFCLRTGLEHVLFVESGNCFDYDDKALREYNDEHPKFEGVVIRPKEVFYADDGSGHLARVSFKVLNHNYK